MGFYYSIEFKDNSRTIEPRFLKNLRTNEARSDFTGPYKKNVDHTKLTLSVVVMISDDFQSLITRLSVLMLFALSLLYIEYSIHSSYKKIFIFPERNILFFCHSVHTSKGSSRRSEKIIKS